MKKRILSLALALIVFLGLAPTAAMAATTSTSKQSAGHSGSLDMEKLTEEEIADLLKDAPASYSGDLFSETPSITAPYSAGEATDEALDAALARLNAFRRIAGLPSVKLDSSLCENAQYGAVLVAASEFSHYPSQPGDMDDNFYSTAKSATSSSNLSYSYLGGGGMSAAVDSFMGDSDASNIDRVGHRRWQLNPKMGKVGFGAATKGSAFYVCEKVFDRSGVDVDYEFIAWPASGSFPRELFGKYTAWSVTLDPNEYATPVQSDLTVTLQRESDKKTWTFSGSDYKASSSGAYFHVDTVGYGVSNCIIFRPDGIDVYDGTYTVTIKGLRTRYGQSAELSYEVDFFSAAEITVTDETLAGVDSWAQEEVASAIRAGLVPKDLQRGYTADITRQDFCRLMVRLVEKSGGQSMGEYLSARGMTVTDPFKDTDNDDVLYAYALGIVNGTSDTTFNPYGSITRQEAATMLSRTAKVLGLTAGTAESFQDTGSSPDWAREGIDFVSSLADPTNGKKVMGGTGDGIFSPTQTYSREQAYLTVLRLFHCGG